MKIALSSDLRCELVDHVQTWLERAGHDVQYHGPADAGGESDWPVVTRAAAEAVAGGDCDEAVVICWTGTGAALCANKVKGVRAALCNDPQTARGARKWNHANALALSIRKTTPALADEILSAWFDEPWTKDDWNMQQIERIAQLERSQS